MIEERRLRRIHKELVQWALAQITINEAAYILDVGCGRGMSLEALDKQNTEGRTYGVDRYEVNLAASRKRNIASIRSGKMKLYKSRVSHLPFDDQTMDLVTSMETYYFWHHPEDVIREMHRVLKYGGMVMLVLKYRSDADKHSEKYEQNVELLDLHVPSTQDLKHLLRGAGFENVIVTTKDEWQCAVGIKD